MLPKYFIDINLPGFFSIWNSDLYVHQYDLAGDWADSKICKGIIYAKRVAQQTRVGKRR